MYDIQFSAQFHNNGGGGSGQTVDIWFRKNGTDVADSNTKLIVPSNAPYVVAAWNFVLKLAANDYVELVWSTDNLSIQLDQVAAGSPPPAVPSVILTATQVMYTQLGPTGATGPTGSNPSRYLPVLLNDGTTNTQVPINSGYLGVLLYNGSTTNVSVY